MHTRIIKTYTCTYIHIKYFSFEKTNHTYLQKTIIRRLKIEKKNSKHKN